MLCARAASDDRLVTLDERRKPVWLENGLSGLSNELSLCRVEVLAVLLLLLVVKREALFSSLDRLLGTCRVKFVLIIYEIALLRLSNEC